MTGSQGTPLLDLQAVEARIHQWYPEDGVGKNALQDAWALLAHCRALRAALQEFIMRFDAAEVNGKYPRRHVAGVYVDRERFERAAAVLALAHDEEAPREADPSTE